MNLDNLTEAKCRELGMQIGTQFSPKQLLWLVEGVREGHDALRAEGSKAAVLLQGCDMFFSRVTDVLAVLARDTARKVSEAPPRVI